MKPDLRKKPHLPVIRSGSRGYLQLDLLNLREKKNFHFMQNKDTPQQILCVRKRISLRLCVFARRKK